MIYGHDGIRAQLESALTQNRLHHAYLLDGPKGVGKAGFAASILPQIVGGQNAENLLSSRTHPDFMRLEIQPDPKTGKMRRDITRRQIDDLLHFLTKHTSLANRKVALIDAANDLNVNAANNLLKWLEEPRPNTCLLLIAHRVDSLLPTIRSRCARLRFYTLDKASFAHFAQDHGFENTAMLHDISGGIPGRALALANTNVAEIRESFKQLLHTSFDLDSLVLSNRAKSLLISADMQGLELSLWLLRHELRSMAGQGDQIARANFAAEAYSKTLHLEHQAKSLNINPTQVLAVLLLDLQEMARQGQDHAPNS